ncbi:hypothetical protein [Nocardia sp. NPDC004604]|uniref:hypothetical protein n=1 Tax=Nocardia sp. NPDC004604 TaxID=3157013 RepID=UPI00339E0316
MMRSIGNPRGGPDSGFEVLYGVRGQYQIDVCQVLRQVVDGARGDDGQHGSGSASNPRPRGLLSAALAQRRFDGAPRPRTEPNPAGAEWDHARLDG